MQLRCHSRPVLGYASQASWRYEGVSAVASGSLVVDTPAAEHGGAGLDCVCGGASSLNQASSA
jgi:hypothetical protein